MPEIRAVLILEAKNLITPVANQAATALTKVATAGKGTTDMSQKLRGGVGALSQQFLGVNLATLGLAGGIGLLAAGLKHAVDQAAESERAFALTEAVIKSTGGVAGYTATQIGEMADKMSRLNAIDDETIMDSSRLLLTFKAIGHDIFPQAQQAAIDLSTAFKMDLRSATMMLGKSLEDPVRGMNALRRAGVTFTAEQQKVIKGLVDAGDAAGAQALILKELNAQVGGAGVAAAKTYSGQLALMKVNTDNLAESLGMKLLPALTAVLKQTNSSMTGYTLLEEAMNKELLSSKEIYKIQQLLRTGHADEATALLELAIATETYATEADRFVVAAENVAKASSHAARSNVDSADAADRYTKALYDQEAGLSAVEAGLSGDLKTAMEEYNATIDGLTGTIVEQATAQLDAAAALKDATAQFLFQQLAVEGDWKANLELARALGILDEASYNTALAAGTLKKSYEDGAISAEQFGVKAGDLATAIAALQDKHVAITVDNIFNEIHNQEIRQTTSLWQPGQGHAAGADFVVPPGYPNDSYPMRVQSGERVQVTPAGKAPGGGPMIGAVNVYPSAGMDEVALAEMVSRRVTAQLRRAISGGVGAIN